MSQIQAPLHHELTFVAAAARVSAAGGLGAGPRNLRSTMARAAELLQLGTEPVAPVHHRATAAPVGGPRRQPARRRTRRYDERRALASAAR